MKVLTIGIVLLGWISVGAYSDQPDIRIPMRTVGTATYYVEGHIEGFGVTQFLVDTGSGYSAISQNTLAVLKNSGKATYIKNLSGIMADGSRKVVPIYLVASINLGGKCMIRSVEVAVFPSDMRPILGLSALRKVAPFIFSLDPPSLVLSQCGVYPAQVHGDKVNHSLKKTLTNMAGAG